ncbi:hypothetical protein [Qipengyuania zhejiangensis]|uniref:hypothetical protein n=1 Tax=Qipengyuania zhejiangensis TaxID=3077782 RepID=UPI002D76CA98|nr:hypothetical protein [Qipengyuania sp. Z2]
MKRIVFALPALAMMAACGEPAPQPEPTPTATVAAPRNLVAADLDISALGARIVGPQGPEVETVLSAGNRQVGLMTSFVACPEGTQECVPGAMPEGTVYTYVHRVTLADVDDGAEEQPQPEDGPEVAEAPPTLFRTTHKAHGFTGALGYTSAEAATALGSPDALTTTLDNGHIIWRVTSGEGWQPGATITFWWQSTMPPAGPADAYLLEVDGNQSIARGPFPAEEKAATAKRVN